MTEPKLIYLEWADAVGKPHHTTPDDLPEVVVLRGYTTLIEESGDSVTVAHFVGSDGGFMDTIAIPRQSIVHLAVVDEVRRRAVVNCTKAVSKEELKHGY